MGWYQVVPSHFNKLRFISDEEHRLFHWHWPQMSVLFPGNKIRSQTSLKNSFHGIIWFSVRPQNSKTFLSHSKTKAEVLHFLRFSRRLWHFSQITSALAISCNKGFSLS